jgi:hypothetical protein
MVGPLNPKEKLGHGHSLVAFDDANPSQGERTSVRLQGLVVALKLRKDRPSQAESNTRES